MYIQMKGYCKAVVVKAVYDATKGRGRNIYIGTIRDIYSENPISQKIAAQMSEAERDQLTAKLTALKGEKEREGMLNSLRWLSYRLRDNGKDMLNHPELLAEIDVDDLQQSIKFFLKVFRKVKKTQGSAQPAEATFDQSKLFTVESQPEGGVGNEDCDLCASEHDGQKAGY